MAEATISMLILSDLEAALSDKAGVFNTVKSLFQLPSTISPEMRMPSNEFIRLIQFCRNEHGIHDIGKRIGQTFTPTQLGLLGLYLQTCDSLKEAIHQYIQYSYLDNSFETSIELVKDSETFSLQVSIPESVLEIKQSYIEIISLRIIKSIQFFCSPVIFPSSITLESEILSTNILPDLKVKMGPKNVFSLSYPLDAIDHSLPSKNQRINALLKIELDKLIHLDREQKTIKRSVINHIIQADSLADTSLEKVADKMAMSSRTLGRRLKEEKTTFKLLLINIKRQSALKKLLKGDSIELISSSLGFADRSSFERAFKTWTTFSPSNIKNAVETLPRLLDQQYITNINSIPSIYKLSSATLNNCSDINTGLVYIKNDPVLSIKIYGLAQITSFGSEDLRNISTATEYLFKSPITEAMCQSAIRNSSTYRSKFQGIDLSEHWIEAHIIAEFCQLVVSANLIKCDLTADDAYLCALSSHLGLLVFLSSAPKAGQELFNSYDISNFDSLSFSRCIEELCGFSAFTLSALLLTFWGYPERFIAPLNVLGSNQSSLIDHPFAGLLRCADNVSFYMLKKQNESALSFINMFCEEYNIKQSSLTDIYDSCQTKLDKLESNTKTIIN